MAIKETNLTTNSYWMFYDCKRKFKTEAMNDKAANAFVAQIKSVELKYWFVWTPGWKKWKHISEVNELLVLRRQFLNYPPVPEAQVSDEKTQKTHQKSSEDIAFTNIESEVHDDDKENENFNGDELTLSGISRKEISRIFCRDDEEVTDKSATIERRQAPRVDLRLVVTLASGNRMVTAHSVNISVSGMLLDRKVPRNFLKTPVDIVIKNPDSNETLHFSGRIVGDLFDPRRIVFIRQPEASAKKLDSWLKKYDQLLKAKLNK